MEKNNVKLWQKIGEVAGLVAILALLVALIQLWQSKNDSESQDAAQSTQIALLNQQLLIQQQMATLQASTIGSDSNATAVAERMVELQSTAIALSTQQANLGEELLFQDNFEDRNAERFKYINEEDKENWGFITDEIGNTVYQIDNLHKNGFPQISFGSNTWKDYAIEYRVRVLDFQGESSPAINLLFRYSEGAWYIYTTQLYWKENVVAYMSNKKFEPISTTDFSLDKNKWYTIRVEVIEKNIRVIVNNIVTNDVKDSHIRPNGSIRLGVAPGTIAQFDDIKVSSLNK